MSPCLFLICAEGLSTIIRKEERREALHGAKICRGALIFTHLFFVDDCFLFFRVDIGEAETMRHTLETYAKASGQNINLHKFEIFFNKNVRDSVKQEIANLLEVRITMGTGKYLRLPSLVGRVKKGVFSFIKERVWKRITSWSGKSLSQAGREILIKSVAQAIPSYCMSIYFLPHTLCDEIQKMLNSFWWGSKNRTTRGINWLSWEKL